MSMALTGRSGRLLALMGSVIVVGLVFAVVATASVDHATASRKKPNCSAFSTSGLSALEGTPMQPYLTGQGKLVDAWPAGTDNSMWSIGTGATIAGSECEWINSGGNGLGDGDGLGVWAAVGYGEGAKYWKKMWKRGGPPFTSGEGTLQSTKRVHISPGTQTYVQTFDLWEDGADTFFTPPQYLYEVTLMTKHHNLLLLAPETVSLGSTESALVATLRNIRRVDPSF
jgi:hypothetical protein